MVLANFFDFICFLVLLSALNEALMVLAFKWNLIEFYQLHRRKWMPTSCSFCAYFWASMIIIAVLIITSVIVYPTGLNTIKQALLTVALSLISSIFTLQLFKVKNANNRN